MSTADGLLLMTVFGSYSRSPPCHQQRHAADCQENPLLSVVCIRKFLVCTEKLFSRAGQHGGGGSGPDQDLVLHLVLSHLHQVSAYNLSPYLLFLRDFFIFYFALSDTSCPPPSSPRIPSAHTMAVHGLCPAAG